MKLKIFLISLAAAAIGAVGLLRAQGSPKPNPPAKKYATMRLQSDIGSFWCEGEGHVELTFRGTLLISDFQGSTLTVTGRVKKEWDKWGRQVWFAALDAQGRPAKLVLDGKWRRLNWFGGDLNCTWHGAGLAMLFGEFSERTGSTGSIQVDDSEKRPWFTTGTTYHLPPGPGEFEKLKVPEPPSN